MSVQNGLCYSYITTSHTSTLSPNPQPKCDFVDDYYRELDDDDDEARFEGNDRRSARLWGVLTGTNLLLYPDENSWLSGSMPLTSLQICSATDPPPQSTSPTFTIFTFSRTLVQCTVENSALTPWLTSIYNGCAGRITSSNPSKTISCQPEISHFPTPTPTPSSPSQKTWSYNRLPLKSSSRTCPLTHCTFNDSLLNQFKNCVPCGRRLSSTVIIPRACPLQQYGFETPCDICIQCFGGQGILNSTSASVLWGVSERYESKATLSAHSIICAAIGLGVNEPTTPRSSPKKSSQDEEDFVVVQQPKPSRIKEAVEGDKALEEKLSTLKTRSPVLKELMGMLRGENPITDSEFLTRLRQSSEEITTPNPSHPFLPVAEDLVTTVKALEHAATKPGPISSLKIILNYLLSLCEKQDTIKQVHLFWGQIVNIYGTIVGGVGVEAWRRVEVLEDFLLTVGVKFSEQMGLEMAWYLLGGVGDVRTWRNREFCVVKFLVEFEAAAKGKMWGRGEDVVSGRYAPSEHQEKLTHNLIEILGEQRYELNSYLSKSVRKEIYLAQKASPSPPVAIPISDLTIDTSNYSDDDSKLPPPPLPQIPPSPPNLSSSALSGQLSLMTRLSHTALTCFSPQIIDKDSYLQSQIKDINEGISGVNPFTGEGKVLGIVEGEGRVFRSKARTPILVYLELLTPTTSTPLTLPPSPPPPPPPPPVGIPAFKKQHKSSSNLLDSAVDSIRALIRSYVSRKVEEKDDGIEQLRNLLMLSMNNVQSDETFVDAGSVDDRLRGCGKVSGAVRTAVEMYKRRELSGAELLTIASKDLSFLIEQTEAARSEAVAFWEENESWDDKKKKIRSQSSHKSNPNYDIVGMIVKANDDVRQETFMMQLINLCETVWKLEDVPLWVKPYKIIATSGSSGVIECIQNSTSIDAMKEKRIKQKLNPSLKAWIEDLPNTDEKKKNFVNSLAAYSIICYLFQLKDRHNGNLLLDYDGHVLHIDFGFLLGIAPGNKFSLETSPFKLTSEMVEVMGGKSGDLFFQFSELFVRGFLALQHYRDKFVDIVAITAKNSSFPCFAKKSEAEMNFILESLRGRFKGDLNREETVKYCMQIIHSSASSSGTANYDRFQYLSQGTLY